MARFQRVTVPNDKDYSDWVQPKTDGYKMACCDCGLVHDIEFKAVRIIKDLGNGYYEVKDAGANYLVQFRAKRNNRSTAQMRRAERKHKNESEYNGSDLE